MSLRLYLAEAEVVTLSPKLINLRSTLVKRKFITFRLDFLSWDKMHIMEGFLPHPWWEIWFAIALPVVAFGVYHISKISRKLPEAKPLLALMGAFIFIISALKLPSLMVPGSSSHPTGSGLAAIIFGPLAASVLSMIALLFQALLLAHGGITTLGANVVSMGIVGPAVAFLTWSICRRTRFPSSAGVFLAVALSDLATYVVTSAQIALAFPAASFIDSFLKFTAIFALTQIPLAIGEGILATFVFDFLARYKGQLLSSMRVIKNPFTGIGQRLEHPLKIQHYVVLIAVVLCLFLLPLFVFPNLQWGGTDDTGGKVVTDQGYVPWLTPIWAPPDNLEGFLFALQGGIGVLIMCLFVASEIRKRSQKTGNRKLGYDRGAEHAEGHAHLSAQIDRFAHTNGLAKVSPITKMFFAASALLLSVLSPSPIVPLTVFAATTLLLLNYAKIPSRFYLELLLYPTLIVAVSSVLIALFFGNGEPLAQLSLPWFNWTIFQNGLTTAVSTFFRVEGALASTYFLVLTTSMLDIFIVLRRIHVPRILVELSLLIYRYIFVLAETTAKMNMAQMLRLGHSSWIKRVRATALLAGNLFIRTLEQGERTFTAMAARGYDGNIRVLEEISAPKKVALAGIVLLDVALVLVALLTVTLGV